MLSGKCITAIDGPKNLTTSKRCGSSVICSDTVGFITEVILGQKKKKRRILIQHKNKKTREEQKIKYILSEPKKGEADDMLEIEEGDVRNNYKTGKL